MAIRDGHPPQDAAAPDPSPPPLSLSDAAFTALVAAAPTPLALLDLDSRCRSVNAAFARLTGRESAACLGRPLSDLWPGLADDFAAAVEQVIATRQAVTDLQLRSDGIDRRGWELTVFPVLGGNGAIVAVGVAAQDVTAREAAAEALREAERQRVALLAREQRVVAEAEQARARLAFLAAASETLAETLDYQTTLDTIARLAVPDLADYCAIFLHRPEGGIERAAFVAGPDYVEVAVTLDQHRRLDLDTGYGVPHVLVTGVAELYPDVDDRLLALSAGSPGHLAALRQLGVRSAMIVPLIAHGERLGAVSLMSCVADRRYSTTDLALAEALATRGALAVANARLYREAQAAVETRNAFLSSVSHDIRNPLTRIKGLAGLASRRLAAMNLPEAGRLDSVLARIDTAADAITAMLDELLDLVRLELGQALELERREVDLVQLVRRKAEEYAVAAPRHQVTLHCDEPALVGHWDQHRLDRVLENLLSNAVKYSPNGGPVTLTLRRQPGGPGQPDSARLAVSDAGIGIPEAELASIFERFRRAANAVGRFNGLGIGLTGVRATVEHHGGHVEVESREGHGTTFTLALPLVPPAG